MQRSNDGGDAKSRLLVAETSASVEDNESNEEATEQEASEHDGDDA